MRVKSRFAGLMIVFMLTACAAPAATPNSTTPVQPTAPTPTHLDSAPTIESHSMTPISHPTESPTLPVTFSSRLNPNQVEVDAGITYQTIDGFGATHLSLEYPGNGNTLPPDLRAQAVDAIYGQVGLNLGNLDGALLESPGGYDQRANDNRDPYAIDWNGFQTSPADAINSHLLALAEPLGFDGYYLSQKVNIRWASPWLGQLRDQDYSLYLKEAAEQVAAGVIYWRDTYGVTPRYMMPFNEPLGGNTELQSSNPREVVDLVVAIAARLEQEGIDTVRFVIPNEETVDGTLEVASAILSDPATRKYVGVIGYHSYPYESPYANIQRLLNTSGAGKPDPNSVAGRDRLRMLSQQYNVPVWMTEVSTGDVDPTSYDDFRGRAIHIHDELVYANASAYFGMNNMWDTYSQEVHFGNPDLSSAEGTVVLIDSALPKVYITGMGYAIGHYARWIKPGSVRVEALSGDPLLQVTAFITPNVENLVVVLINNNASDKEIAINFKSAELVGNISGEQSTPPNQYWSAVTEFSPASPTGFTAMLPAGSVTTYVLPFAP